MEHPAEKDAATIIRLLDPHWRTDCSDSNREQGYVRWVRCRCGWASEKSGTQVNAPDMHRIWNAHLADVLTRVIPPEKSDN